MLGSSRAAQWLVAVLALLAPACAVRKPQTYRLAPSDRTRVLVPPGVASADTARATLAASITAWQPSCAPGGGAILVRPGKRKIHLTVSRDALLGQPPGWLGEWTAGAEAQGCLAAGEGLALATRILESIPLDPSAAYRLLHADGVRKGYVDLGTETRLQVVSPIIEASAAPDAPVLATAAVSGSDRQIAVTAQTTPNLLGVETAWYGFQPKRGRAGSTIVPLAAERSIAGRTESADAPLVNYFHFSAGVAYYRLFYKTDPRDNGITEIMLAAPTRAELEHRTQALMADFSPCRESDPEMCMVIPRRVAVNPFLAAIIDGAEVRLAVGTTVRRAVQAGHGPTRTEEVLPSLRILKPYNGKPVPVEFARSRPEILDLVLLGGESVSWK
jgi:hypothetical protein